MCRTIRQKWNISHSKNTHYIHMHTHTPLIFYTQYFRSTFKYRAQTHTHTHTFFNILTKILQILMVICCHTFTFTLQHYLSLSLFCPLAHFPYVISNCVSAEVIISTKTPHNSALFLYHPCRPECAYCIWNAANIDNVCQNCWNLWCQVKSFDCWIWLVLGNSLASIPSPPTNPQLKCIGNAQEAHLIILNHHLYRLPRVDQDNANMNGMLNWPRNIKSSLNSIEVRAFVCVHFGEHQLQERKAIRRENRFSSILVNNSNIAIEIVHITFNQVDQWCILCAFDPYMCAIELVSQLVAYTSFTSSFFLCALNICDA